VLVISNITVITPTEISTTFIGKRQRILEMDAALI